jgi:hypothetical protein
MGGDDIVRVIDWNSGIKAIVLGVVARFKWVALPLAQAEVYPAIVRREQLQVIGPDLPHGRSCFLSDAG